MWVVGLSRGGSHQPRAKSTSMQKASGRSGRGTRLNVATQVDSSDDSRQLSDELLDALERDLAVVAPKRRARRVFNDGEALVHLSRGRFQVFSSDDEEHHEDIMPTQVDRESAAEDPPSQCVAVAAHPVLLMAVRLPRWSPED